MAQPWLVFQPSWTLTIDALIQLEAAVEESTSSWPPWHAEKGWIQTKLPDKIDNGNGGAFRCNSANHDMCTLLLNSISHFILRRINVLKLLVLQTQYGPSQNPDPWHQWRGGMLDPSYQFFVHSALPFCPELLPIIFWGYLHRYKSWTFHSLLIGWPRARSNHQTTELPARLKGYHCGKFLMASPYYIMIGAVSL